jgi:hypothetical protein
MWVVELLNSAFWLAVIATVVVLLVVATNTRRR